MTYPIIIVTIMLTELVNVLLAAITDRHGNNWKWGITSLILVVVTGILTIGIEIGMGR